MNRKEMNMRGIMNIRNNISVNIRSFRIRNFRRVILIHNVNDTIFFWNTGCNILDYN